MTDLKELIRQHRVLTELIGVEKKRVHLMAQLNGLAPATPTPAPKRPTASVKTAPTQATGRKKRTMDPKARAAVSRRMKRYWASRREEGM